MSPQEKNEKSLRYSVTDGIFASLMGGFTTDYFTPFLLLIGGTARHVGILSALPNLLSSLAQLKSPDMADRLKSRKRLINIFVLLQALMLLPMLVTYRLGEARVSVFIAIIVLFTGFGAIAAPAWGSLMADLIQEDKRGEYLGWRGRIIGFSSIGASFAAGLILHALEKRSAFLGFAAIFSLAFVFRLVSWRYLRKMHEPELKAREEDYFTIFEFVSRYNRSNFARFVFFVAALKFSVYIASPFFAVLMLRDLKFDYLTYTAITLSSVIAANMTIRRWGVHGDKAGNLKVVRLSSRLVAFIPLLWLLWQNPVYLFFVQAFSGFAWAGFNLSASNFIYDSSTPEKRTRCIAYFNVITGLSVAVGAVLGGYLAQRLSFSIFGYPIMNIILLSAAARFAIAFIPFNLREVRDVERIRSHKLFFSVLGIRPTFVKALGRR